MAKKTFAERLRENIEEGLSQSNTIEPDARKRPGTNEWYAGGEEAQQIEQARGIFARADAAIARVWARFRS